MASAAIAPALIFPGHVIGLRDLDTASVTLIQKRLNQLGCGPIGEDGDYGPQTQEAVELFQVRSADHFGAPLDVDGKVGPLTWASLFAIPAVPVVSDPGKPILLETLRFAATQIGVMEQPLGSNRGPQVDLYLKSVSADLGSPWCAAFVYFCFQQAAARLGSANPLIRVASVLDHWNRAGAAGIPRLSKDECVAKPSLVKPGMIFIIVNTNGSGHCGLVESVTGTLLTTIEGTPMTTDRAKALESSAARKGRLSASVAVIFPTVDARVRSPVSNLPAKKHNVQSKPSFHISTFWAHALITLRRFNSHLGVSHER